MRTKINQKFTKKGDLFYSLIFFMTIEQKKTTSVLFLSTDLQDEL